MTTPRTVRESWSQLKEIVLDWHSPPQTWVKAGAVRVFDLATSKPGAVAISGAFIASTVTALTVAVIRNLNAASDYWDAACIAIEGGAR